MPHSDPAAAPTEPPRMRLVGELACQGDSYLRSLATSVVSCVPAAELPQAAEWVKAASAPPAGAEPAGAPGWCVQLRDTPLFAEGGGQPPDTGRIAGAFVSNVQRIGMEVWHLCDKPVDVGAEVEATVDWERRWDHMQHHSAQHLLTATVEKELGLPTTSWGLGREMCYIQLGVNKLSPEQLERVEKICNDVIRDAAPVTVTVLRTKDEISEHATRSGRTVPEDITGPIRLIDLHGVERSTCCGTHVRHLAQLQLIRLLHFEPKGNTLRLFWVAGDRAVRLAHEQHERERALVKALCCREEEMAGAVDRIKKSASDLKKAHSSALKELAPLVGSQLAAAHADDAKALFHHRDDADMNYLMAVAEKIVAAHPQALVVMTLGDRRQGGEGQLLIAGPAERLAAAAAKAEEVTAAKGGANKGKWRGKMPSLKKLKELEKAGL